MRNLTIAICTALLVTSLLLGGLSATAAATDSDQPTTATISDGNPVVDVRSCVSQPDTPECEAKIRQLFIGLATYLEQHQVPTEAEVVEASDEEVVVTDDAAFTDEPAVSNLPQTGPMSKLVATAGLGSLTAAVSYAGLSYRRDN